MRKGALSFLVVILLVLNSCDRVSERDAWLMDMPIGDECWVELQARPDDCFFRPPCAYYDATLRLRPTVDGNFVASLSDPRTFGDNRRESRLYPVASTRDAVMLLPELLRALDVLLRPAGDYCVVVFAEQSMRFRDVLDTVRGLERSGARHVTLFMQPDAED
jgi:hypothetical protein